MVKIGQKRLRTTDLDCIGSTGSTLTDEFGNWKKMAVASSSYYPGIPLEGLWKLWETSVRVVDATAETRIGHLPVKIYR
jgi:hypothetical protein